MNISAKELKRLKAAGETDENIVELDQTIGIIRDNTKKIVKLIKKRKKILRLISQDEKIVINACDGKETFAQSQELFPSGVDENFKAWGLDNQSAATPEIEAKVYELIGDATFAQMFKCLGVPLEDLCLTQDQIIGFRVDSARWLRDRGYATFFLFKRDEKRAATPGNLLVAYVYFRGGGLNVFVSKFANDSVFTAECRHRVVVPQLTI